MTAPLSAHLYAALSDLRMRLSALYGDQLAGLRLFGSQARRDAEPDSDIDLLIILYGDVDPVAELRRTRELLQTFDLDYGVFTMPIFMTAERYRDEHSPLLLNVRREGIAL